MTPSQQAPLVERPHSAKCLGERFQDAFLAAWGQERGVAYADLPAEAQAKWNRAAVAFVCTLSDAPSEAAAGIVDGWRERAERAEAQCRALQRIVDLARELVSPAGMVNRGVDRGLVVVEKADKSDPHYRLCAALDALSLSGGGGREEKGSLPESPSADAGPYPRSHDDQRSDGGRG
ncbi:MAG: hypothetical protein E6Q97_18510 [Desulfurellales bacterium]|nr:MAG: hypothetical protein E6Q97_18510 [Desulfurellales bacterium]